MEDKESSNGWLAVSFAALIGLAATFFALVLRRAQRIANGGLPHPTPAPEAQPAPGALPEAGQSPPGSRGRAAPRAGRRPPNTS